MKLTGRAKINTIDELNSIIQSTFDKNYNKKHHQDNIEPSEIQYLSKLTLLFFFFNKNLFN